ncbi:MAG: hypothetical protein FVQ85_18885 [Planctomycetes bacterium]|nr:hypothetical protein [Planctomycetota bacterium]
MKLVILGLIVVSIAGCGPLPNQGTWETKFKGKTGVIAMQPGGCIFMTPRDIEGQATVSMKYPFQEDTEFRIVAVDNKGKIHTGTQSSKMIPEQKYSSTEAVFPGLTLKDIKDFQLQMRPYEQKTDNR